MISKRRALALCLLLMLAATNCFRTGGLLAQGDLVVATAYDPLDHASPSYTVTLRDTATMFRKLFYDIEEYRNTLRANWSAIRRQEGAEQGNAEQEALVEDVLNYAKGKSIPRVQTKAMRLAEMRYNDALAAVRTTSDFDTIYNKYATPELRTIYRDIVLGKVKEATEAIGKLQGFSEDTREKGMLDIFNEYWNSEKARKYKRDRGLVDKLRADVLAALETGRETFIEEQQKLLADSLSRTSLAYGAFEPVMKELDELMGEVQSAPGMSMERVFKQKWTPWFKKHFTAYSKVAGEVVLQELTKNEQHPNPDYDPQHAQRTEAWNWVDGVMSITAFETDGDYRTYNEHPGYKVRMMGDIAAVYNAGRLVAISKSLDNLRQAPWALSHTLYEEDFKQGRLLDGLSREAKEELAFRLHNHLPPTSTNTQITQYLRKLESLHANDWQDYQCERYDGREFIHYLRGASAKIRETYVQGEDGNIYRTFEVLRYDTNWEPNR